MDKVILSVVINMRKKQLIKTRLYFILLVLLLTAVCIVVYTSIRSDRNTDHQHADLAQEQQEEPVNDTNLQSVNSSPHPQTSAQNQPVSKRDAESVQTEPAKTTYTITVTDGCLQVYIAQTGQLYMETAIEYDLLPDQVQEQIDAGKNFESEQELLEFLENYSS